MCLHKKHKFILFIFLILVFFTGCSELNQNFNSSGIITGKVILNHQATTSIDNNIYNNSIIQNDNIVHTSNQNNTILINTMAYKSKTYIMNLKHKYDREYITQNILKNKSIIINKINDKTYTVKITEENKINNIQDHPAVSYIEPDYLVFSQYFLPDDPEYYRQWSLDLLEIEKTWSHGYKGSNDIIVAIIDTGITDHSDLRDNLIIKNNQIFGKDYIDNDYNPIDEIPGFKHGTHVAGIIGAATNNNKGIAGINWEISLLPVRIIGPEGGTSSDLASAIRWAADYGAHIINLSLATMNGSNVPRALEDAVKYAHSKDVIMVAASGNGDPFGRALDSVSYPASFPEVISVGSINRHKERSTYSNYGRNLDLVAPGDNILSTDGTSDYSYSSGTSMATPHVTGIAALLYSSGLTNPDDIKNILKETAFNPVSPGENKEYGSGLVDINRALGITNTFEKNIEKEKSEKITDLKIYTAKDHGHQFEITSGPVSPDENGFFNLEATEGNKIIVFWLDTNNNRKIDTGDYYKTIENIQIKNNKKINIGTVELKKIDLSS